MKVEKVDGSPARSTLIAMITCPTVLGRVASRWEPPGLFDAPHMNLIGGWCVEHFTRYGKAPMSRIESYFHSWGREDGGRDEDTTNLVSRLLGSLAGQYERRAGESNPDHALDVAAAYFDEVRLKRQMEAVKSHVEQGKLQKAWACWNSTQPLELSSEGWIDPLHDLSGAREAFRKKGQPLIRLKGGAGEFFGTTLERDGFVAVMASSKKGKSYTLLDLLWKGLLQGRKCAYFVIGDMSRNQVWQRIMRRTAKRPFNAGKIQWPVSLTVEELMPEVEHEEIEFDEPATEDEMVESLAEAARGIGGGESLFRMSVHASGAISMPGIRAVLDRWSRDGFDVDVCVIDYADNLQPPNGKMETRDAINENWKGMRRLSQELHCLLLTATQADADSYEADLLRRSNFANDRRKYDHVTYMFGLNQTDSEKKKGLYRLNWLVGREEDYSETEVCHTAGCLAVCAPMVLSHFRGVGSK